ncbi:MAG: serine/threonine-protein kinase, partial [Steroidobacteraceae bacterium]
MKELTPGLELGARFALVRRLGRGGSAEVWLADDRERGLQVALKVLDDTTVTKGTLPFAAAAKGSVPFVMPHPRLQSLPREFVVPVHDVVQADGLTLVAMEYQSGGDLGQFRGRSFESWGRAAGDVAAGLAACHAVGLVHRDLKCSNVLLDGEGRARLSDFGLATPAGSRAPGGGSPYNASPQQLRGEPAEPADDLYALGALLYELIAGHPPYYPDISRDRVLHEPVPPLVPRGAVPVGVRELALRLLAKSPQERPANAAAVRDRLAAVATDDTDLVEPLAHALPAGGPPSLSRRPRWLPVATVAALTAVIAAVFWLPRQFAAQNPDVGKEALAQAERSRAERLVKEQHLEEQATSRAAAEA